MNKPKALVWTGRVLSVLAAMPFVVSGIMKFAMRAEVVKGMGPLGLPESILTTVGILELGCCVLYLIPQTCILGAILFTGYVGGTILTGLRVGQAVFPQVLMGILLWLGLYLREDRLKNLIPFRK